MKIRSHTGSMVDARVGMVCVVEKSAIPVTIESIEGDCAWCSFDVSCDTRRMIYASTHLTMLSCPFMVGDEVKANTDEWGFIGTVKEIGEQDLFVAYCGKIYVAPKAGWLHSNPDLRAKGEV